MAKRYMKGVYIYIYMNWIVVNWTIEWIFRRINNKKLI